MTMLGAQLDDLDQLSQQLTRTAGDIGSCQADATATTSAVVESVRQAATEALARITAHMDALTASVEASQASAAGAMWTGVNADTFRQAASDFAGAMRSAHAATTETFTSFRTNIEAMASQLSEYGSELSAAMAQAEESTTTMATAVQGQRANLDEVMNTGMRMA